MFSINIFVPNELYISIGDRVGVPISAVGTMALHPRNHQAASWCTSILVCVCPSGPSLAWLTHSSLFYKSLYSLAVDYLNFHDAFPLFLTLSSHIHNKTIFWCLWLVSERERRRRREEWEQLLNLSVITIAVFLCCQLQSQFSCSHLQMTFDRSS